MLCIKTDILINGIECKNHTYVQTSMDTRFLVKMPEMYISKSKAPSIKSAGLTACWNKEEVKQIRIYNTSQTHVKVNQRSQC